MLLVGYEGVKDFVTPTSFDGERSLNQALPGVVKVESEERYAGPGY